MLQQAVDELSDAECRNALNNLIEESNDYYIIRVLSDVLGCEYNSKVGIIEYNNVFVWCKKCKNHHHTIFDAGCGKCFTCLRLTLNTFDIEIPQPAGFD